MSEEAPSPPIVAPPVTPASTTTTKTETVKTTVGGTNGNGEPSVIVVTQSKMALINQSQASACALLVTLTLCVGFLVPLFSGGTAVITSGELIGFAGGVVTGAAMANSTRGGTRATDTAKPGATAPTTGATP